MHWSTLLIRSTTTTVIASACLVLTTWGPCAALNRIPRTMHPDVYCGIDFDQGTSRWMNWGTSILDDRFQFFDFSYRPLGAAPAAHGHLLSLSSVLGTVPRTYTSYIRNNGSKSVDWPDYVYASGWPVRCATLAVFSPPQGRGPRAAASVNMLKLPMIRAAVPMGFRPIPVLIDLAVFAILIELVRFAVRRARALRQIGKNCCAVCGYSLAGIHSPNCPECGVMRKGFDAPPVPAAQKP